MQTEQFGSTNAQIFPKKEQDLSEQDKNISMQNQINNESYIKNSRSVKFDKQYRKITKSQKKKQFSFFTSVFMLWVFVNAIISIYNFEYLDFILSLLLALFLFIIMAIGNILDQRQITKINMLIQIIINYLIVLYLYQQNINTRNMIIMHSLSFLFSAYSLTFQNLSFIIQLRLNILRNHNHIAFFVVISILTIYIIFYNSKWEDIQSIFDIFHIQNLFDQSKKINSFKISFKFISPIHIFIIQLLGILFMHFCRYISEWYFKVFLISVSSLLILLGFSKLHFNINETHSYLLILVVCSAFFMEQKIEKQQFIHMFNKIKVLKEQKQLLDILIPSGIFVCQFGEENLTSEENKKSKYDIPNILRSTSYDPVKLYTELNNTRQHSTKKVDTVNNSQHYLNNQSNFGLPSALKNFSPSGNIMRTPNKQIKIDYANKNSLNIFEVQQTSQILDKLQYMMQEEADQQKQQDTKYSLYQKVKQQLSANHKYNQERKKSISISGQIEIVDIIEEKNSYKYGQSYFNVKFVNCYWNQQPSLLVLLVNVSQEKRNQQLQQMNSYKDKLLATVSHDLKTPLNCIISLTGQIKEMNIESIAQNIDIIYNNSLMLLFMIKDILDYSQIMHRKLKLSSEKINLQQCVKEVFDIFQFQCSSQNIDLIQQVEDITFYNDKNRLKQIIINFVSNAIKFTKQGFVTVKAVSIEDCVRISVGDTGTGMSEAVVKQLFKEYGTFDNNEKMNQQGIGLGLVICKNLVGALGPDDNIKVESTVGLGSTFTFDIYKNEKKVRKKTTTTQAQPSNNGNRFSIAGANGIREQNGSTPQNKQKILNAKDGLDLLTKSGEINLESIPQEGDIDQLMHQGLNELNMSLSSANITSKILAQKYKTINSIQNRIYKLNRKYNIIIVDDSKYNLIALKIYLNDYKNFEVEEFIHAEKALQRIKECQKKYDIIFTDLQMPFMDGLELTKQIRQLQNRIQQPKIVIVSADSSDFQKIKSFSYGINDFIEKPITDKDLFRSKITKLLD